MVPKTTHVAVAAAVAFVAFAAWHFGGWSHGDTVAIISNIWQAASSLSAAVFAALAARTAQGRARAAWTALAVGVGGWFLGQLIWSYYEIVAHQDPFPSVADVGFLMLPVGACVALLLFPDEYSNYSLGIESATIFSDTCQARSRRSACNRGGPRRRLASVNAAAAARSISSRHRSRLSG